jgi:uncharacterized protein (DUF2384 family)
MSLLLQLMMGNLMQNERPEGGAFTPPLEQMEEGLQVYGEAALAFGDPKRALRWMDTPSDVFGGKSPIGVLHDPSGRAAVRAQLARIAEGIFW